MADQAALQEAIQRARQLAAKISQNQPVKRPASSNDHSGPVKVTLAYEKPANSDDKSRQHTEHSSRRRSSSRDHNRNVRDFSYSRESRGDSRDSRDYRENSHGRESRDQNRNHSSGISPANENNNLISSSSSSHENNQYESSIQQHQQPPPLIQSQSPSRSSEEKIEIIIPHAVIGLVIGKGGENIKRIQNESGATVRVDPNTVDERGNKLCTITGTKMAVEEARLQVENVIENAATIKRPRMQPVDGSTDSFRMKIPASRTGAIIGKGGETIKSIKQQSGCDIELDKQAKECGPEESVFIIRGSQDKIMKARSLIEARLAVGNRDRDGRGGGMRDHRDDHHSGRGKGGVATGANAAPVGQYPDLPAAAYPGPAANAGAGGQQNSADMTAAWAAYFAQYSTLFNQTGAQPSTPGMSYPGQPSMLGATAPVAASAATPASVSGQSVAQMDPQPQQPTADSGASGGPDYSEQWIEYYMANGRPDYAEQIIQMKKQLQQGHK